MIEYVALCFKCGKKTIAQHTKNNKKAIRKKCLYCRKTTYQKVIGVITNKTTKSLTIKWLN
jgi:hypothetical protein